MLAIIVPYRDREEHLKHFIPHMNSFMSGVKILIVEQADSGPFNRGKLLNIGFLESPGATHYCFHDVDLFPIKENSYFPLRLGVTQLASSRIQKVDYLGGVTVFDAKIFKAVGGYHNEYFHRAEDNEMMFNLKRRRVAVTNLVLDFALLHHPRSEPEFIPELWQKAQIPRIINMLENCKYELISKEVHETHTHIKVML